MLPVQACQIVLVTLSPGIAATSGAAPSAAK